MKPIHQLLFALICCTAALPANAAAEESLAGEEIPQQPEQEDASSEETTPNDASSEENPPWAESPPEPEPEPQSTTYLPPPPPPPLDAVDDGEEAAPTAPAPTAPGENRDMCESVSCNGQGACVIQHGSPTCACYPGFLPDRVNGLSCVPEARLHPPERRPAPNAAPSPVRYTEADYQNLQHFLRPEDISATLAQYRSERDKGEFGGSFPDYLRKSFKRTQNLATVSLAFGIAALAGGLSCHMFYAGFSDRGGFLAGAVVLDIAGVGLISTGAVFTAKITRLTRKLDRFENSRKRRNTRVTLHLPGLSADRNGAGIRFGFSFL